MLTSWYIYLEQGKVSLPIFSGGTKELKYPKIYQTLSLTLNYSGIGFDFRFMYSESLLKIIVLSKELLHT